MFELLCTSIKKKKKSEMNAIAKFKFIKYGDTNRDSCLWHLFSVLFFISPII